jgi:hypothetical protein
MTPNGFDFAQASRAYTITALTGATQGIDRFALEGLLGHGGSGLIDQLIHNGHLVEIGDGRHLLAGKPPRRDLA